MYYLKRKVKKNTVKSVGEFKGLAVRPKNKVKEVVILDEELANNYIKKQLDKKFKKMYDKVYLYLTEDDSSEDGVKACLSEIEKLKSLIFYKYEEYMKKKLYKEYLAKIVLTTNELKKKDAEREMFNEFIREISINNNFDYEEEKGRSR